jgi:flavodoxin
MKIGIVIHTVSGHTLKFAQAIRDKLVERNHEVDLMGLRVIGSPRVGFLPGGGSGRFSIKSPPELGEFDAVLIGAPVWGFKPSPVILQYLAEDLKSLNRKKAIPFVTFGGIGGKRALAILDDELQSLGADVLEGEALVHMFKFNAEKFNAAVDRICERLDT